MKQHFLFLDCNNTGISGDLFLSSLSSIVGIQEFTQFLQKILPILSIPASKLAFIPRSSLGIQGIYFDLKLVSENQDVHLHMKNIGFTSITKLDSDLISPESNKLTSNNLQNHSHNDSNDHHHDHSHDSNPIETKPSEQELSKNSQSIQPTEHIHYSITEMRRDLDLALNCYACSTLARGFAHDVLNTIIQIESEVHGIPIEKVHLHEIGSLDTILDIVGTTFSFEKLGVFDSHSPTRIYFSSIAVGGGTVKFSHGRLPVPAPATAKILEKYGLKFHFGPEDYELATPTGVAILAQLKFHQYAIQNHPPNTILIEKSGIGVGSLSLKTCPNILQSYFGELMNIPTLELFEEMISVIETNVDDVRGEILGNLINVLLKNGALDVSLIPCSTKKNRPGTIVKVIADQNNVDLLVAKLIAETGTLGVRINREFRKCLNRKIIEKSIKIDDQEFIIHIKQGMDLQGNLLQEKIEFEDLLKISEHLKQPIREIERKIVHLLK